MSHSHQWRASHSSNAVIEPSSPSTLETSAQVKSSGCLFISTPESAKYVEPTRPRTRRRSTSFNEVPEVYEFFEEPNMTEPPFAELLSDRFEDSREKEQEQPELDRFAARVETRKAKNSATMSIGLHSFSTVALDVRKSALWKKRATADLEDLRPNAVPH